MSSHRNLVVIAVDDPSQLLDTEDLQTGMEKLKSVLEENSVAWIGKGNVSRLVDSDSERLVVVIRPQVVWPQGHGLVVFATRNKEIRQPSRKALLNLLESIWDRESSVKERLEADRAKLLIRVVRSLYHSRAKLFRSVAIFKRPRLAHSLRQTSHLKVRLDAGVLTRSIILHLPTRLSLAVNRGRGVRLGA